MDYILIVESAKTKNQENIIMPTKNDLIKYQDNITENIKKNY